MALDRIRVRAALKAALNRPSISRCEFLAELRKDFPRQDFPRQDVRIDELIEASKRHPEFIRSIRREPS